MQELIETDVLVIGSGIAGATAAIKLADAGIQVVLVTRASDIRESNSFYAQGGIIYKGLNEKPLSLANDIFEAGANICNPRAVEIISTEGPGLVKDFLIGRAGIVFDQKRGELCRAKEGGHSTGRIIHCADETGKAIESALAKIITGHANIHLFPNATAVDLLTPNHHSRDKKSIYEPLSCAGAYILDKKTGAVSRCLAKSTVLATGGLGQIYEFTTNPEGARGDGIAMADRAGARIINLEFIQFHPTAFYKTGARRFLITEAARGEGTKLVDSGGRPFMGKYDRRADLATRDIVARSIYQEMTATKTSHVFLDLKSYISKKKILNHFPMIRKTLLCHGIDIARDLVPVVPAAHYSCGGVYANAETGETTINNLYAIGEVACNGSHGANRLASASLLEGLVWGNRASVAIAQKIKKVKRIIPNGIKPWVNIKSQPADMSLVSQDLQIIRGIMWNCVGLERTSARLARARTDLGYFERSIERFYQNNELSDEILGLRNIVKTAVLVTEAAWENKQSAGCHYRK